MINRRVFSDLFMALRDRKCVKKGLILATLAISLLTAPNASATQIDWTGLGRYAAIRANLNGHVYDGVGGELTWQWLDVTPTGYIPTFYAYCVDLLHYLHDPQTVTIKSTDLLTSSRVSYVTDAGKKAAWLFNAYTPGLSAPGLNTDAAALQVAIWEALYDPRNELSGGSLKNSSNSIVTNEAMTYLAGLYSGSGSGYPNGYRQDQIIAMPVPEPASVLLFGTGLLGLARGLRHRRRAAAASAPEPVEPA